MRIVTSTFLLIQLCILTTSAQSNYHKIEISGGYSVMRADGIVGDGDVFTDDVDDPLTLNQDIATAFPSPFSGLSALFPANPLSYSGKMHYPILHGFNGSATYNFTKYIGAKFEVSGNYRSNDIQTGTLPLVVACLPPSCTAVTLQSPQISQVYRGLIVYPSFFSRVSQQNYNYLGGIQIKNNSKEKRVKPFAHVLAGVSKQTVKLKDFTDSGDSFDSNSRARRIYGTDKISNTGFTMQFGGGLDIRLSKRLDLRVIQFDYNPVRIKEQQILAFQQPITGVNIPNNLTFLNTASPDFTQYSPFDIKVRSRWQNNFRIGIGVVFH